MGYLPEAMRNYLARLGWSHGNDEFFTTAQAIEWFDLSHLGKAPSRFDFSKLENLSGQHMRAADDQALLAEVDGFLAAQNRSSLTATQRDRMLRAMPGLKERAKTLPELLEMAHFILGDRPFAPDASAAKALAAVSHGMLSELTSRLQHVTWRASDIEAATRDYASGKSLGLGKVAQPLRAALTGRAVSPGVFDMMEVLGREESLARLADCAETLPTGV